MGTILITDASVLINLVASGAAEEVLDGCGMEFKVCPDVVREVRTLRDRETGEEHPIDLAPLFTKGCLGLIQPETDDEFELLVDYSALLGRGDGEAMCFALAESRGHMVAIDDQRAIRKALRQHPEFKTTGTLEILMLWQTRNSVSDERLGTMLRAVFRFARFRPAPSHPEYAWWERCWPG